MSTFLNDTSHLIWQVGTTSYPQSLSKQIEISVHHYLIQLGDTLPDNLYGIVFQEVEKALFKIVMKKNARESIKSCENTWIVSTYFTQEVKTIFA